MPSILAKLLNWGGTDAERPPASLQERVNGLEQQLAELSDDFEQMSRRLTRHFAKMSQRARREAVEATEQLGEGDDSPDPTESTTEPAKPFTSLEAMAERREQLKVEAWRRLQGRAG